MFGKKKKIGVIAFLVILVFSCVCGVKYYGVKSKAAEKDVVYSNIKRDTVFNVNSGGQLEINRNNKEEKSMGNKDTWTLFMYVTGSDLESYYKKATEDFKEMWAANFSNYDEKKVKIVIQTGGSDKWYTDGINKKKIQRFLLENNTLKLIDEQKSASMGDGNTLYDFLDWGVSNYPAEHMGIVFWNHGSGISQGICCDTLNNNDTLMLSEVECVFARIYKKMTDKFDIIGFDTCLSGALEYANALVPYGRYMVASADVEPGDGWYYTDLLNYLFANSDATGEDVGKIIVDSYKNYYSNSEAGNTATMAVYDLKKVDDVCIYVNNLAKNIYDSLNNKTLKDKLVKVINNSAFYSKINIDLGSLVDGIEKEQLYDVSQVKQALNNMIIYNSVGEEYGKKSACGLSLFMALEDMTLAELNVYRNAGISPYWIKVLETFRAEKNELKDYQSYNWENSNYYFEDNFGYIKYENPLLRDREAYKKLKTNDAYAQEGFLNNWYDLYELKNIIKDLFYYIFEDMSLTTLPNELKGELLIEGDKVYTNVYKKDDDKLINLGENSEVDYNEQKDTYSTDFSGKWFMLSDGQLLSSHIISKEEDYIVYELPILIDEKASTIRVKVTLENNKAVSYKTLGVWDAVRGSSCASRGYLPLIVGSEITPIYDVIDTKTQEVSIEYGNKYTVGQSGNVVYDEVEDGQYVSALQVERLNNLALCTELEQVDVYNGNVLNGYTQFCMN